MCTYYWYFTSKVNRETWNKFTFVSYPDQLSWIPKNVLTHEVITDLDFAPLQGIWAMKLQQCRKMADGVTGTVVVRTSYSAPMLNKEQSIVGRSFATT